MIDRIVINTGPLIVFGKIGAFDIIRRLPFDFITPAQVENEIVAGTVLGYPVSFPDWIEVIRSERKPSKLALANLDAGEVAVIETAIESGISHVCIDELKGRRAALSSGLQVVGSLGILGRAKKLGLIEKVTPFVRKAQTSGSYYDSNLVEAFLKGLDE